MKKILRRIFISLWVLGLIIFVYTQFDLIHIQHEVKLYTEKYAVKNETSKTTYSSTSGTKYYFTKETHDLDKQLISVINSSTKTLNIAIYTITEQSIADAILSAKDRGILVQVITDSEQATTSYQEKILKSFVSHNIPVKINTHDGIMHLKVTIVDDKIVTTGSYNYSITASTKSDEVLIVIKDEATAKMFYNEFSNMWKDTKNFATYK